MKNRHFLAAGTLAVLMVVVWFSNPFLLAVLGCASLMVIGLPVALISLLMFVRAIRNDCSVRPALTMIGAVFY